MNPVNLLAAYNESRDAGTDRSVLCHAPFVSLNFDQLGRVTTCCFNRTFVLGRYPEQNVRDIWTGVPAEELRDAFRTGAYAPGCDRCFAQLNHRNFSGALMRNFDRYTAKGAVRPPNGEGLPLVFEFEISNTCNLECVMCAGTWSSAIRARREKLPPLPDPYDRRFVDQVEEFVPTLAAAKFLGGEPFIINRYHEIWDSFRRLNPNALLSITTSGATLPDRSRAMLEHLRSEIVVSLDGITRATYESIRVNARFDDVMENLKYFRSYTRSRGTNMTVAACPMTHNWRELSAIVDFCEEHQIVPHFNTVTFPVESTLAGLAVPDLDEVVRQLDAEGRSASRRWSARSKKAWEGLTNQLRSWLDAKRDFSQGCRDVALEARRFAAAHLADPAEQTSIETIEPLVEPLIVSVELARKRERDDAGATGLNWLLLPQHPLTRWRASEPPATRDLLLAMHLVRRFIDGRDAADTGDDEGPTVAEHQRLRRYLDLLLDSPDNRPGLDRLATEARERLRYRAIQPAFDIVEGLVRDAERIASGPEPDHLRRELGDECERLNAEGFDEDEDERIRAYVARLLAFYLRPRFVATAPLASAGSEVVVRIRDARDVRAFLRAVLLFDRCVSPAAAHEAFRRRVDFARDTLARNLEQVMESLQKPDITQIYRFWSSASDEEFAAATAALS